MYEGRGNYNTIIIYTDKIEKVYNYFLSIKIPNINKIDDNTIYISQTSESDGIDIVKYYEEIKEKLDSKGVVINKYYDDETGILDVDLYVGKDFRNLIYNNTTEYYGIDCNYNYENKKECIKNIIVEIKKIINDNINILDDIEIKKLIDLGLVEKVKSKTYKPSQILKIEVNANEKEAELPYISSKIKYLIISEQIEVLKGNLCSTKIEKIELSKNLKQIGSLTFSFMNNLTEIKFYQNFEKTGVDVFMGNKNLKIVDFRESKLKVLEDIFSECKSLEKVYLPDTLEEIVEFKNKCIFADCKNVTLYSNNEIVVKYAEKWDIKCLPLE